MYFCKANIRMDSKLTDDQQSQRITWIKTELCAGEIQKMPIQSKRPHTWWLIQKGAEVRRMSWTWASRQWGAKMANHLHRQSPVLSRATSTRAISTEPSSTAKESLLRTQWSRYLCFRDFTPPWALAWSDGPNANQLVELIFWLS